MKDTFLIYPVPSICFPDGQPGGFSPKSLIILSPINNEQLLPTTTNPVEAAASNRAPDVAVAVILPLLPPSAHQTPPLSRIVLPPPPYYNESHRRPVDVPLRRHCISSPSLFWFPVNHYHLIFAKYRSGN
ncbi:unnamed protein product [Cuscuta europaea]|uniref:Uncharacterized protein n=1 Tax=Cuscuta europaea TaxID=41803 RepID=A0A9P0YZ75_CUSEU|nr:unnamed protein product [Cuscuta europaea]